MKKWLILSIICFFLIAQTPVLAPLTIDQIVNMTSLIGDVKVTGLTYDGQFFLVSYFNTSDHISQINSSFNNVEETCDLIADRMTWGISYANVNNSILTSRFSNASGWWKWVELENDFVLPTKCGGLRQTAVSFSAGGLDGFDVYKNFSGARQHYLFKGSSLKNLEWTRISPDLQIIIGQGFNVANTSQPRWIDVTVKQDAIADDTTATHMWALSGTDFTGDSGNEPGLLTKIVLREPPNPSENTIYTINLSEQGFPNIQWIEYDYNDHIWLVNDTHGFALNITAEEEEGIGASSIKWIIPRLNDTNFNFELNTIQAQIRTGSEFVCRMEWFIDEVNETQCARNITPSSFEDVWCNKNISIGNHTSDIRCFDVNNSLQISNPISFSVNLGFTGNIGITIREALGLQTAQQGVNVLGLVVWFFMIMVGFMVGKINGGLVTAMGSAVGLAFIGWMDITITVIIIIVAGFLIATMLRKTFLGEV